MQIFIVCNNLRLLIYGLLFVTQCHAGRIFGEWFCFIFFFSPFIHLWAISFPLPSFVKVSISFNVVVDRWFLLESQDCVSVCLWARGTLDGYIEESIFCPFFGLSLCVCLFVFFSALVGSGGKPDLSPFVFVCLHVEFARYCKCCAPFDVWRYVLVRAKTDERAQVIERADKRARIHKFYGYFFAHVLTINIPRQKTGTNDIIAFNNNNSRYNTATPIWLRRCVCVWQRLRVCVYVSNRQICLTSLTVNVCTAANSSEHIHINID